MNRPWQAEVTNGLLKRIREQLPDAVLRTTFIVGFPGETQAQFEELKEFVTSARFERMGVFPYSLEPGTPAVKLDGHLPQEIREARRDELMELQQRIAFEHGDSLVGYELDVLLDEQVDDTTWVGRTYADAPEIDGQVYVTGHGLEVGQFVPVEVAARQDYDLVGVAVTEDADQPEPAGE